MQGEIGTVVRIAKDEIAVQDKWSVNELLVEYRAPTAVVLLLRHDTSTDFHANFI